MSIANQSDDFHHPRPGRIAVQVVELAVKFSHRCFKALFRGVVEYVGVFRGQSTGQVLQVVAPFLRGQIESFGLIRITWNANAKGHRPKSDHEAWNQTCSFSQFHFVG